MIPSILTLDLPRNVEPEDRHLLKRPIIAQCFTVREIGDQTYSIHRKHNINMPEGEPVWAPRWGQDDTGPYWVFRQYDDSVWYFTRDDVWDACHPSIGWQAKLAIIILAVLIFLVIAYIF